VADGWQFVWRIGYRAHRGPGPSGNRSSVVWSS